MIATLKPWQAQTTSDLMSPGVITIRQDTSLREAAELLFEKQIGGVPVVDADGRCVGLLSATDFVHWAKEGARGLEAVPTPACPYRVAGRMLNGAEVVICTLAPGNCPWQEEQPTLGGRHTAVCRKPPGARSDWQQVTRSLPSTPVQRFMTPKVATIGLTASVSEVARAMVDAHIHRLVVVDEERRPVGIVASTDVLAAVARADLAP